MEDKNKSNLDSVTELSTDTIEVTLPNFFQTFLTSEPELNPYYDEVRRESEKWLGERCDLSAKMQDKVHRCDFSFFCAVAAPRAPPDKLRLICDWGNWIFPFDDMFDDGDLQNEKAYAKRLIKSLLQPRWRRTISRDKRAVLVRAHDDFLLRLFQDCSRDVKQRYLLSMQAYCAGVLSQINTTKASEKENIEKIIKTRRGSIGATPLYHLVEYGHGLTLPSYVLRNSAIRRLEALVTDIIFITNDIISYRKEERDVFPSNIVATCRMNGMTAQEAFDKAGDLLQVRYDEWTCVEACVPSWGDKIDHEVTQYIEGLQAVASANLYWSFRVDRYGYEDYKAFRRNRKISIMSNPPYLGK